MFDYYARINNILDICTIRENYEPNNDYGSKISGESGVNPFEQIEVIKNYIVKEIDPEQVILFGSYARGDYDDSSDTDMLIVTSDSKETENRWSLYKLYTDAPVFQTGRDFIIKTKSEFDFWKESLNHVIGRAYREGKVIYDKNS